MKTETLTKTVLLSVILMLASCSKDSEVQNLTRADIVGTWKTEYFEQPPIYGPLTAKFTDSGEFVFDYFLSFDDGEYIQSFEESGTYTISGNILEIKSEYNYTGRVVIEDFTGTSATFSVSNGEIGFTAKANKQ